MGGGLGSGTGGGDLGAALGRIFGGQGMAPSTIATGGATPPPIGGVDIPPANMRDQFGGPEWANTGDPGMSQLSNLFAGGFGNMPSNGQAISGPTQSSTFWSNNNTGNANTFAPLGIPLGGWVDPAAGALPHNLYHAGQHLSTT